MQNKGYPEEFRAELKRRNDIISIVSKYVQLERKGNKYWGCCPFHHEKTASFCVNDVDQFYYCFGCKESGDVITFVEKMEGLDFPDAVKYLAENARMEIPEFTGDENIKKRKLEKERILKILNVTYKHYVQNLYKPEAKLAQEYIKQRGLTKRELEDFQIGYSLNWTEMIEYLKSQGFTTENMLEAGICQVKENRVYDVMAERLVFPIFNSFGDCVGFSARVLVKSDYAKYKNTAETVLFTKGKIVYGIHLIRKLKQEGLLKNIIIVEGQMDVIAMHRAGFKNTVACMGTALTEEHARELKRFTDEVILCFDGDEAGIKSTVRGLDILKSIGLEVKVAMMPEGQDPDEVLKNQGADALHKILDNSLVMTDFLIEHARRKHDLSNAEEKAKFVKETCEIISKLESAALKDIYLNKIKAITNLPMDVLRRDLVAIDKPNSKRNEEVVLTSRENGNIKAIKFILASLLYKKEYANVNINLEEMLDNSTYKKVYRFIKENKPLSMLYDEFDVDNEPLVKDLIGYNFDEFKNTEKQMFNECLWTLKEQMLNKEQQELMDKFRSSKDIDERREIAKKLGQVTEMLKSKRVED